MRSRVENYPIRGNVTTGREALLSMPSASVYFTAAQAIVDAGTLLLQAVIWDTSEFDEDALWDISNPSLFYCRTAGVYACTGWVTWVVSAVGYRQILFRRTTQAGVVTQYGDKTEPPCAAAVTGQEVTKLIPMNAGDALQLYVGQNTGGNLSLTVATATDRENGMQACLIST